MRKTSVSHGQLRSIVERIERLEDEKKDIADQIRDVYAEAKAEGFDTKIIRQLISIRKKEPKVREEEQSVLEVYMSALGMIADLPLGQYAMQRDGVAA